MPYPVFKESQRFNQTWLWAILLFVSGMMIFIALQGIYRQLMLGEAYGNNPVSDIGLIMISLFFLLFGIGIPFLFNYIRLETEINKQGIIIVFRPFFFKPKQIQWDEIKEAKVRKYRPLLEYGGWGIRFGLKGKAYNTRGNMGLQLHFVNGKRLLIGTQKPLELEAFLRKLEEPAEDYLYTH
jgi:hypothetical protein